MAAHHAELSSIEFLLTDVEQRVHGITLTYEGARRDDVVAALYEAERALKTARTQLTRASRAIEG